MKLPVAEAKYGAPIGRVDRPTREQMTDSKGNEYQLMPDFPRKFYVQNIRINSGGYDSGGAYWGLGPPLYWATEDGGVERFLRAANREDAKKKIRAEFPGATFFR